MVNTKETRRELMTKVGGTKGAVKAYRANPGSLAAAVTAAVHYAKRNGEDMLVLAGNSYGFSVYHIIKATCDPKKVTVIAGEFDAALAKANGEVFKVKVLC